MKKTYIKLENLNLLSETHDFFDTRVSKAVNVFLYSILALIISLVIWATCAKMDDVVKATAILRPTENISELKSLSSGEVLEKNYVQNQKVSRGDLLLEVDCKSEENELQIIKEQKKRYEEELEVNKKLYSIIENEIFEIDTSNFIQAESYIAEYKKLKLQVDDLQKKYDNESSMPSSLRTPQKIEESKNQLEQAQLALSSWKNNKQISLKEVINNYEEKIQSLNSRIVSLERSIKNARLYAPIDGFIDEQLSLNQGDYILGGTEVLRVIPSENEHLKAEIVVDASKVARVKVGQEVKLRFPGLPPSSFGQLKGKISLIPADLSVASNNPVFIVEAEIPEPYLYSSKGDKVKLRSGLSSEARIVISRDTIIKMILRKLDFIN